MGLIPEMAGLGLFGANLPEEYGCAGMNDVAYGLVMQELERGDSAIRSFASVQGALVMYPIFTFGQRSRNDGGFRLLPPARRSGVSVSPNPTTARTPGAWKRTRSSGGTVGCSTAPNPGSRTGRSQTSLWSGRRQPMGIRGFLVEKGTRGFSAPEIKHKMSLRASVTSQLVFEDCEIPGENLLPVPGA